MPSKESDTKKRILAAAEFEFLNGGYDRTRMQAIADRAKINKAMLHYHFRSKDELFAQIFREKAGILFPKVSADLAAAPNFIELACRIVDAYFTLLSKSPQFPALLLQVASNHQELLDDIGIDFPKKFVRAFNVAKKNNEIREHDAHQFVVSVISMCVMPFVGKNLFKSSLAMSEKKYQTFLKKRAEEVKRYVVLLLTPENSGQAKESDV